MLPRPPSSTLFPYTTLFRSSVDPEALFTTHQRRLFKYFCRAVGQTETARDLTQDVFLRVSRATIPVAAEDRKSTRLNSSHRCISYAVFWLKKKKKNQ